MPSGIDRAGGCGGALRLLLRPLYRALVCLSALLPLLDGLSLWSALSLPLSAGADPISGARVRAGNNSTRQCADPAGTTAAANPIVGQIHPESRAASERNAAMILSASPRAPGSWVRM